MTTQIHPHGPPSDSSGVAFGETDPAGSPPTPGRSLRSQATALAVAALLGAAVLLGGSGLADEGPDARVEALEVAVEGDQVLVGFRLDDVFDDDLVRRIESGLPTEFVFQLELERDRKRWFDTRIRASTLRVVAMYNAMNREYLINTRLDGKLISSRAVRERTELREEMTRFDELAAFALAPKHLRERLVVRARAQLGTRTVLFFVPTTVTTPWAASDTFVPADASP